MNHSEYDGEDKNSSIASHDGAGNAAQESTRSYNKRFTASQIAARRIFVAALLAHGMHESTISSRTSLPDNVVKSDKRWIKAHYPIIIDDIQDTFMRDGMRIDPSNHKFGDVRVGPDSVSTRSLSDFLDREIWSQDAIDLDGIMNNVIKRSRIEYDANNIYNACSDTVTMQALGKLMSLDGLLYDVISEVGMKFFDKTTNEEIVPIALDDNDALAGAAGFPQPFMFGGDEDYSTFDDAHDDVYGHWGMMNIPNDNDDDANGDIDGFYNPDDNVFNDVEDDVLSAASRSSVNNNVNGKNDAITNDGKNDNGLTREEKSAFDRIASDLKDVGSDLYKDEYYFGAQVLSIQLLSKPVRGGKVYGGGDNLNEFLDDTIIEVKNGMYKLRMSPFKMTVIAKIMDSSGHRAMMEIGPLVTISMRNQWMLDGGIARKATDLEEMSIIEWIEGIKKRDPEALAYVDSMQIPVGVDIDDDGDIIPRNPMGDDDDEPDLGF